jgi:hypothetical protein
MGFILPKESKGEDADFQLLALKFNDMDLFEASKSSKNPSPSGFGSG